MYEKGINVLMSDQMPPSYDPSQNPTPQSDPNSPYSNDVPIQQPNSPYPETPGGAMAPGGPGVVAEPGKGDGMAIAGLVLGIISLVLFWLTFFDLIPVVLGIVFSILGRRSVKRRKMATWGLVLSIIGLVLVIIYLVFVGALVAQYMHNTPTK
jgi:hypothetical protein